MDLLRAFGNVQRVVGDTLKVVYGVQIFSDCLVLFGVKLAASYVNEICSELILVFIDDILGVGDVGKAVIGVVADKRKCVEQIFASFFGHGVYRQAALLNGKRRVVEESLLEPVEVLENSGVLGLVFDDELADFFEQWDKRSKYCDDDKAKHRVHKSKADRCHGH